ISTACPRCQNIPEPGARFCQGCGMNLSGEQTLTMPSLLEMIRQATIGEYEILGEIGQGGMATVFLAHEIALDRKVAIKVMSPQQVHGKEAIERFKREARTAANLNHPHIIPIYAVRDVDPLLFMVMKFVNGRSLDTILRDTGPLSFPMIRTILADVSSALDYAHRQGVVHRDIKPGNILLDDEGFAFITDFGIAKAAKGENLTRTGTTVGTPSYLSPEACSGLPTGPAADQYSLGIVGYEMVTGLLPFTAESSLGMMYAQVHNPPRPTEDFRPDCPPDLLDSLDRMLEKQPEDRFANLKEAALALGGTAEDAAAREGIRTHIGLLALPPGSPGAAGTVRTPRSPTPSLGSSGTRRRPRRKNFTPVWIAGGVVLTVVSVTVTWLAVRPAVPVPVAIDSLAAAADSAAMRADSTLLVARGAAEFARDRAVAAGAPAAALARGDSMRTAADSLAGQGRKAEAAMLLAQAAGLWSAAERVPVRAAPAPRTTSSQPAPQSTEAATTPVAAPSAAAAAAKPPSDSAQIAGFFASMKQAVEARQMGVVSELFPNMTDKDAKNWRNLFRDDKVESVTATYDLRGVTETTPGTIEATVFEEVNALKTNGKLETKQSGMRRYIFTHGPAGWRPIRYEKAG
ncbi:MAG: serine/threonine protein kinase, partial [Gemmatimonadota bacterium]|nr:serine/threonine protein kinase [Gemmatimonadota bacterium]